MQHPRAAGDPARPDYVALSLHRRERCGAWTRALRNSDVNQLWAELHRIVSQHPLVRSSRNAGLLEEGALHPYTDLTQELFTQLLTKQRFHHYLDTLMTDAEIEFQISQVELTNLLTAELSKRNPESYRLARRIAKLIQTSAHLRRFDDTSGTNVSYMRLVHRLYGLRGWPAQKQRRPMHEAEQRIKSVPVYQRDMRVVGRTGDVQVIISNAELEKLIIRVLEAADTPLEVRHLRSFVLSRLPVLDIYLVPLNDGPEAKLEHRFEPRDGRANPEQALLRREAEREAAERVEHFLGQLRQAVRGKAKQYSLLLRILWHSYLSPERRPTQLATAALLGVSDTLVSRYRQQIERQLQACAFSELEAARQFEMKLSERVAVLVQAHEEQPLAAEA
jgi:hypothetical protein